MSESFLLGALLTAAAVTLATLAGWIGAAVACVAVQRLDRWPAAGRARFLAGARLLPLILTSVLVPTQMLAFVRFEAGGKESAGPLLLILAATGMVLVATSVRDGWRARRRTRDVSRRWRQSAVPFTVPGWPHAAWRIRRRYPVVAILGLVRPQLFMAGQVADACTREELAAIGAHERAHARAGDNVVRWLFAVTPGAGFASVVGRRLEGAWMAAAEEAADAVARRQASPLDLASALIKVARLASGLAAEPVASSTLVGGSDLKTRVERLVAPAAIDAGTRLGWLAVVGALTAAVLLQTPPVASTLHELFELLVRKGG